MITMLKNMVEYINKLGGADNLSDYSKAETAEALATLMRQLIISDGVVRDEEVAECIDILKTNYSQYINAETEPHLKNQLMEGGAESIFPLIAILKNKLSRKEYSLLKTQLITIAKSDKEFHHMEEDFIELVEKLS